MADAEDRVPRVRLVEGQEVSLGCGTLIVIALIVIFFAGRGNNDVERELRLLRNEVSELNASVQSLETAIERDRSPAEAGGVDVTVNRLRGAPVRSTGTA